MFVTSILLRCDNRWKNYFCYDIYWYPSGEKGDEERGCYSYCYPLVKGKRTVTVMSRFGFVTFICILRRDRGKNGDCLGRCLLLPLVSSSIILFIDQRGKNDWFIVILVDYIIIGGGKGC